MALKKGLGRGLDAILQGRQSQSESAAQPQSVPRSKSAIQELPTARLRPNRYQPRSSFDAGGLEELAASIVAQGMIQPLVVAPNGEGSAPYTIIAGERRWRAARLAGIETVPVVIRDIQDDRELLELALVENIQRADLNVIEEAEAYRVLRESFRLSQQEISERVGRSRPTITNCLRLLRLPATVLDFLREGRLSSGQARPLLALQSSSAQVELAQRIVADGLSARQVEALVGGPAKGRKKRPSRSQDVHTAAAAERLTKALRSRVEIRRRGNSGKLSIYFHSEEELMRIYDRLLGPGGSE